MVQTMRPVPPAMEAGAAAAWSMPTTLGHGTDPILDCLVQLSSCLERPCSAPALIAGLPLVDDRLTPALAVRALEGAGFAAVLAKRSLDQIAKPLLPCLLFLEEQKACLLLALDGGEAVISLPETAGGEVRLARSDLEHDMTGYVLFAKLSRSSPDVVPDHEAASTRHWFWSVIAEAWPVYAEVALAALMINLFALASPLFVMNVYDRVVPNPGDRDTLGPVVGRGDRLPFRFRSAHLTWLLRRHGWQGCGR